jgi:hypothetical protein
VSLAANVGRRRAGGQAAPRGAIAESARPDRHFRAVAGLTPKKPSGILFRVFAPGGGVERATRESASMGITPGFTGVKVFSATKAKEREELGETITRWLRSNADLEVVDQIVTQSSDNEFHCLSIILFYREKPAA